MLINKLIGLSIEFVILFFVLMIVGPVIDASSSNFTGDIAQFCKIIIILAPSPDDALIVFIEAVLIIVAKESLI